MNETGHAPCDGGDEPPTLTAPACAGAANDPLPDRSAEKPSRWRIECLALAIPERDVDGGGGAPVDLVSGKERPPQHPLPMAFNGERICVGRHIAWWHRLVDGSAAGNADSRGPAMPASVPCLRMGCWRVPWWRRSVSIWVTLIARTGSLATKHDVVSVNRPLAGRVCRVLGRELRIGVLAGVAVAGASWASGSDRMVPFFPAASDALGRQGFVRVVNHSDEPGDVTIEAIDDEGASYGPVMLAIEAHAAVHFNAEDLEGGNVDKGLTGRAGAGQGDWRLNLSSERRIEVLSYIRTRDGFVTSMHDTVPWRDGGHRVAVFNPGSNEDQQSLLRIANIGEDTATVSVAGVDDAGAPGAGTVTVQLAAGAARTYSAAELESGNATGLDGSLGDGAGKWQLAVRSDQAVSVMSLLSSPGGELANLSSDGTDASTIPFDYGRGELGFTAGFADYPPARREAYALTSGYRALPAPFGSRSALFIGGDNHSDDLFMFFKGKSGASSPAHAMPSTSAWKSSPTFPPAASASGARRARACTSRPAHRTSNRSPSSRAATCG